MGYERREAVRRTVNECIDKGILEDVLIKHRAEVEDMFLTTFNKKMYEEAVRMDARAEGLEEGRAEGRAEGRKEERILLATKMKAEGLALEVISRVTGLSQEECASL